ncbi:unnamed protein product [Mytilus edulis]|uniref:Uncharacterized protein n=1 Tax=Mytilus edulis TaxID=6550 RepID=A0A8S3QC76_MYTED|nr:unnamed protein product [Mytilus edulis]
MDAELFTTTRKGNDRKVKGENARYDLWRHDIRCLLNKKTHSVEAITQAVRRSVKGGRTFCTFSHGLAHIVANPSLKTNTKNICKKSTKTEDEETEPDLKVLIQQINTRLEKIEKGAPENSDAQGYSDTSGYTGAPRFNNPSGYSGARGSQPYRGGYRGNNRGYRGYNRGFQPRYNNPNFTPNTNYNKDIPIICRRYKTVKTPPKPKPRLKPIKSPQKPKSDIITDTSDLASESSSEDECCFVPAMTTDSAPTSTEDTVALQEVEIEQDTTESVGDAQSDIQEIRDDSELGSASGIDESSHDLLNADETVQSGDSDALDDLLLTSIPPPRSAVISNWKTKAEFMASAIKDGTLSGSEKEAGKALIYIIMKSSYKCSEIIPFSD